MYSLEADELPSEGHLVQQLNEVMPAIASLLASAAGADRCAVFVYDQALESTIALYRHGYEDWAVDAHLWTNPLSPKEVPAEAEVLRTGKPLQRCFSKDEHRLPLVNPGQEALEGRLRDLVLPIVWNQTHLGACYIWRKNDPTPYTSQEIQRAEAIADLAAMTIVFARQYEEERLTHRRLTMMREVVEIATSSAHLDQVLHAFARAVRMATEADICNLYVYDERCETVDLACSDGLQDHETELFESGKRMKVPDVPVEKRMHETLQPELVTDFENQLSEGSSMAKEAMRAGVSSILALPVVYSGRMTGVIYAWYREPGREFSATAIDLASAIASQAGSVVERARLQESLERQSAEREALLRIGQAVLNRDSLHEVLDEIADVFRDLIPFDYACAGLLTDDEESISIVREWGDGLAQIVYERLPVNETLSGAAVRSGVVTKTSDVLSDPRSWKGDPRAPAVQSIMVAPLVSDRGTLGTLLVARYQPDSFTPSQERLFSLLSQQAATAVARVQSREQLANRERRQAFLSDVVNMLIGSANPLDVLPELARRACGVLADGVIIGLAGPGQGSMKWVASSFSPSELKPVLEAGLRQLETDQFRDQVEAVPLSDRVFLRELEDIAPAHLVIADYAQRLGVDQFLVVPLFQPERGRGMMVLLSRRDSRRFDQEDIELSSIIAHRIADALEREQALRNREALMRVSEVLHRQSTIEEVEQVLAREINGIMPLDQFYIGELDRESNRVHSHLATHAYRETGFDVDLDVHEGIRGEVLRTGKAIIDNQAERRSTSRYLDDAERRFYREHGESVLAAPLMVENEVTGALFASRTGNYRFTRADLETFLLFAGLAGATLDRTRLLQHNRSLYRASVEVLAAVVDAKDPLTLEHSRHVAYYSRLVAELMACSQREIERIELAGLLHDIGKLGIPDEVLQKPGRLSAEEFELIKTHPEQGARILERHPALTDLVPLVKHHHEWMNGKGYPLGLTQDQIPLGAAIVSVADAFDTMTSERGYQRRKSMSEALLELEQCSGDQFHPDVVARFVDALRADPGLFALAPDAE